MTEYQCPSCFTPYTPPEYEDLDRQAYPEDAAPQFQGQEAVCAECGAGFTSEGWSLVDDVVIRNARGQDSTARIVTEGLTVSHGLGRDEFFETRIEQVGSGRVEERYTDQEAAEAGHESIVDTLAGGDYDWQPAVWRLTLEGDPQ